MAPATTGPFPGAGRFVPATADLARLENAARHCEGCDLYRDATATVFGRGPAGAAIMLVGEQPGDREDRTGEPFVGPAGHLLDRALAEAGIDRDSSYLTNAVKHFRFKSTASGKRRIHAKPAAGHLAACRPWLVAELAAVQPRIVVALGATAAASLLGSAFRLTAQRGRMLDWPPPAGPFAGDPAGMSGPGRAGDRVEHALATVHPSAVLRADDRSRSAAFGDLVADLRVVGEWLAANRAG
jgi:DNA polymerase